MPELAKSIEEEGMAEKELKTKHKEPMKDAVWGQKHTGGGTGMLSSRKLQIQKGCAGGGKKMNEGRLGTIRRGEEQDRWGGVQRERINGKLIAKKP